jgi:hypothetical protein
MEWNIEEEMCVWVGIHHFFANNDLLVAWEFELLI